MLRVMHPAPQQQDLEPAFQVVVGAGVGAYTVTLHLVMGFRVQARIRLRNHILTMEAEVGGRHQMAYQDLEAQVVMESDVRFATSSVH